MLRQRRLPAIGVLLLFFLLPTCTPKLAKQTGLAAPDLLARGRQNLASKKYGKAIEAFQVLLERFPNSPLASKAQLGLADARMNNKDNVEAEVAFDDFLRLYPADDNVPYALYRKGDLLSRQASDPGRDQTKTLEAIKAFTRVLEKDPKGPYAEAAAVKIAALRNRLAEHEKRVISHYLGRKRYASAEARARRALLEYPETPAVPSYLSFLAEALEKQGKKEQAAETRKSLAEKFPAPGGKKP
jgi:outer membrane protein assembly factor BamD